jgi:uncharacterized protein (TIGR02246 family)
MRFGKTIFLMALALGGGAMAAPPAASDRAALERLAAANDAAWTAKDWAAITGQYVESGTLRVAPTAPIEVGRNSISRFFRASFERRPAGFRHVTRIDHIEMVAPDVAVADGYVRVERADAGGWTLVREFTSSSLVVRDGGQWKLHSVRATPLPTAATPG